MGKNPIWRSYFWNGLVQPPTNFLMTQWLSVKFWEKTLGRVWWIFGMFWNICLLLLCFFLFVFLSPLRVCNGYLKIREDSMTPVEKEGLQIQKCATANRKSIYRSFMVFLNGIDHRSFTKDYILPTKIHSQNTRVLSTFPVGLPKHKTSRTEKIHLLLSFYQDISQPHHFFWPKKNPWEKICIFPFSLRWTALLWTPCGLAALEECFWHAGAKICGKKTRRKEGGKRPAKIWGSEKWMMFVFFSKMGWAWWQQWRLRGLYVSKQTFGNSPNTCQRLLQLEQMLL